MTTLTLPPGLSADNFHSCGISSVVFLDEFTSEIIKVPRSLEARPQIEVEKRIYERLSRNGHHYWLLKYRRCEAFDNGSAWAIHLDYASEGQLSVFLREKRLPHEELDIRIRWIRQIGHTLRYIHSENIFHGDISCNNLFLDEHLNARLGDFAGSSIDGSELLIACSDSHDPPWPSSLEKADIFALGSVYYHIVTGFAPFHELPGHQIKTLFENGTFPETTSLGWVGPIIRGCWEGQYNCMDTVVVDIDTQGTSMDQTEYRQRLI